MALRKAHAVFVKIVSPSSHPSATRNNITPMKNYILQGYLVPPSVSSIHTSTVCCAGHAKWQNIAHIKKARDSAIASVAQKLSQELKTCLTRFPQTDPKLNPELAAIIQSARKNQVSNDLIAKALDRVIQSKDPKNITTFDGRGPANTGIIIECFAPKPNHTKGQLQGMVKKFGFSMYNAAEDLFKHTGYVDVTIPENEVELAKSDPDKFDLDKYIDMAIEVGAEDVALAAGEDAPILQFVCHPNDCNKVMKAVEEGGLSVVSAEPVYEPVITVPVSADFMDSMRALSDKLEAFPEFIKFYTNVVPEDKAS